MAWWTGVTQKVAKEALRRVAPREVQLRGREDVLYGSQPLLEGSATEGETRSITLLPHWDPYMTAHVDRSRYLPDRWRDRVIDRGGNSTNVILVGGEAGGVWDYSEGVFAYAGFKPGLNQGSLRAASKTVASVLGELDLVERNQAPSLWGGGQNAFQSPLQGVGAEESEIET